MITYQKQLDQNNNLISISKKEDTVQVACIPVDAANMDFLKCLEWVSEGNTLEEAD